MKKLLVIVFAILAIGAIVFTLMQNKKKAAEKLKTSNDFSTKIPVNVIPVSEKEIKNSLNLVGVINPFKEVNIATEVPGRIRSVNFKEGDFKGQGSVLVTLDNELKSIAVETAENNYNKAKQDLERYQQLVKEDAATQSQLEQYLFAFNNAQLALNTAYRNVKDTKINAPMGGIINTKNIEVGSYVAPGTLIANMVDISKLKVRVNVPETEVFRLRVGDNVTVTTDIYPDETFDGKISVIAPKGDEAHTYPVEIIINNSKRSPLKAGMFARIDFSTIKGRTSIAIPREAIVGSIRDAHVYVIENNKAVLKKIETGLEGDKDVEVTSGLNVGEMLVITGGNNLKDGTEVSIVK
ncbi:MAG: efflux RND transporter periplasmic adaptor subunit [Bacteroidetes bacterium]|nr:efflux RND transporter periplasmic adaptor subunit [Bacteroidota bacterium]